MNKTLLYISLICIVAFSACKKNDEHIFDKPTFERMDAALEAYKKTFVDAPYGWRAVVFPDSGKVGGFNYYFKFTNNNRVSMLSDWSGDAVYVKAESSYSLKGWQQPTLIFDTYSYLHLPADPGTQVNGGAAGKGLLSDFEFAIDTVKNDTVMLTGSFHGSKAYMVPATKEEAENFEGTILGSAKDLEEIKNFVTYFKRLTVGANDYDVSIDFTKRVITLTWNANGINQTFTSGFYYQFGNVKFTKPFIANGAIVNSLNNIRYDVSGKVINLTINNNNEQLKAAAKPVFVDLEAPQRWYQVAQGGYGYTYSDYCFTVEGKPDGFGITTLPNYYFFVYAPNWTATSDIVTPLVVENNALKTKFGIDLRKPQLTNDGRIVFSSSGITGTVPDDYKTIVGNIASQFASPNGYYMIEIDENVFDMISAKDAKVWIRWYPTF